MLRSSCTGGTTSDRCRCRRAQSRGCSAARRRHPARTAKLGTPKPSQQQVQQRRRRQSPGRFGWSSMKDKLSMVGQAGSVATSSNYAIEPQLPKRDPCGNRTTLKIGHCCSKRGGQTGHSQLLPWLLPRLLPRPPARITPTGSAARVGRGSSRRASCRCAACTQPRCARTVSAPRQAPWTWSLVQARARSRPRAW